MAEKDSRVDLVLRAAQKLQRSDNRSLAERAAEKLAQINQAAAPAGPVEDTTPSPEPLAPPAAPVSPEKRAPTAKSPNPEQAPSVQAREKAPPAEGTLTSVSRRTGSVSSEPEESEAVESVEHIISSVEEVDAGPRPGILTAGGRRAAPEPEPADTTPPSAPQRAQAPRRRPAQKEAAAAIDDAGQHVDIDLMRLHLAGYVTPQSERTRISEEYRVIKRPLLLNAFARGDHRIPNGHLIMVTSARPGEGKTFTALNLAMSMASERELYVLLIDADVHRATLMSELGIKAERGLVDMLVDDSITMHDTLLRTNIPNLTVLPSGMHHADATELLASQRMTKLMEDIANRYPDRVIIIDTPPILASSEAGVLGLLVGQVAMVVEWGATNRQAVEQALPLIGTCPNINFVLNKASFYVGSDRFGMYTNDGVYGN